MEQRVGQPGPLVVSLGGNAFARDDETMSMAGQFSFAAQALAPLSEVLAGDRPCLVTHGNGPQVGYILTRVEEALGKAYALPLEVCVAESEGEIGYVLQQTLHNLTAGRRPVATLLTQVVVDPADPAFERPTKPVGPWFPPGQAEQLAGQGMALVYDDAGRGRRVVPSPQPLAIVEGETIARLLELGVVVIAAGGGGIPVIDREGCLEGVEAVVDKDFATALLATSVDAARLVLVTGVPGAYTDFGSDRAQLIGNTDVEALQALLDAGHFPEGSMGPKVAAALSFVRATGRPAVICQPADLAAAIEGRAGTVVEARRD
jgi:carbamate kinase